MSLVVPRALRMMQRPLSMTVVMAMMMAVEMAVETAAVMAVETAAVTVVETAVEMVVETAVVMAMAMVTVMATVTVMAERFPATVMARKGARAHLCQSSTRKAARLLSLC